MSIRTERVAAVIQRDLGEIIQKEYQPSGSFITVTRVDISPDLQNTNVYVSVYAPGRDEKAVFDRLTDHATEIRKALASKVRHQLRRVPELHFKSDSSASHAQKMEKLFDEIEEERQSRQSNHD